MSAKDQLTLSPKEPSSPIPPDETRISMDSPEINRFTVEMHNGSGIDHGIYGALPAELQKQSYCFPAGLEPATSRVTAEVAVICNAVCMFHIQFSWERIRIGHGIV